MTDRERLVELLKLPSNCMPHAVCEKCGLNGGCSVQRQADKILADGWMRPPCKVGDIIWVVFSPKYPANPNDKGKWFMVQDGVQRIIFGKKGLSIETWNMGTIPAKELNKKIFLTKEEAEEKLKGLQE